MEALCDGRNDRVIQHFRIQGVPQRCKRHQYYAVLPTEVEQILFGKVGMGFDLHGGWPDLSGCDDFLQFFRGDVR